MEIDDLKILCDVIIQWVHLIQARRLNMIVVNKGERKCNIIDIIVPVDGNGQGKRETKEISRLEKGNQEDLEYGKCGRQLYLWLWVHSEASQRNWING